MKWEDTEIYQLIEKMKKKLEGDFARIKQKTEVLNAWLKEQGIS